MKPGEVLGTIAALITIGAAVWFVLERLTSTGGACCSACASGGKSSKGFGGGKGGGFAPPRKGACG